MIIISCKVTLEMYHCLWHSTMRPLTLGRRTRPKSDGWLLRTCKTDRPCWVERRWMMK